jgi:aspartyl-tRNA(Asn)/glutamyl-tRNA(Gln) amidotransferase subunit A
MSKYNNLTIKKAADGLERGDFSSLELTEYYLDRIKKIDKEINSFITVTKDRAIDLAKASDKRRSTGETLSVLDGIPYGLKDVFCTKGIKTTAASRILNDFIPPFNSTVYNDLEEKGAILLGKTNTDEFTMGSSTETSHFGPTKNPWDRDRVPGGSSGGSAAAVAADLCTFALGTDTGGSIRQPASFTSTVGIKVSYGLISRFGVISYASSFDTIGPLTKSVEDAAIILEELSGADYYDSTTIKDKPKKYSQKILSVDSLKGKKIGLPKEFIGQGTDNEIKNKVEETIKLIEKLDGEVEEMSLPSVEQAIAVYYILVKSEASSNLARYDGIKYGYSKVKEGGKDLSLDEIYSQTRENGFGDEVKRSIMLGSYTLSAGYFDAYYKKAAQIRTKIKEEFAKALTKYDLLLTPVSPVLPFKLGENLDDPLAMYLVDVGTTPINVAGVPAISLPVGFSKKGLPIGMQFIGGLKNEEKIIEIASLLEKEINITRRPEL